VIVTALAGFWITDLMEDGRAPIEHPEEAPSALVGRTGDDVDLRTPATDAAAGPANLPNAAASPETAEEPAAAGRQASTGLNGYQFMVGRDTGLSITASPVATAMERPRIDAPARVAASDPAATMPVVTLGDVKTWAKLGAAVEDHGEARRRLAQAAAISARSPVPAPRPLPAADVIDAEVEPDHVLAAQQIAAQEDPAGEAEQTVALATAEADLTLPEDEEVVYAALSRPEGTSGSSMAEPLKVILVSDALKPSAAGSARHPLVRVYFQIGRAELTAADQTLVMETMPEIRSFGPEQHFMIVASTDSTGPADLNEQLSQARAETLALILIDNGIEADRLKVITTIEAPDQPGTSSGAADGPMSRTAAIFLDDTPRPAAAAR
jgi:outer membrane protein OmpA-like peptidoglycan-associated protein